MYYNAVVVELDRFQVRKAVANPTLQYFSDQQFMEPYEAQRHFTTTASNHLVYI